MDCLHQSANAQNLDPNISFEVVNYSTHELKYPISIRDISTPWSGPTLPPPPPPPQDLTEFAIPSANGRPIGITTGPDGASWFAMSGKIGRITVTGAITEFSVPTNAPTGIALGPDGALWFADQAGTIGRIRTDGAVTLFRLPTPHSQPIGIARTVPLGARLYWRFGLPHWPFCHCVFFGGRL